MAAIDVPPRVGSNVLRVLYDIYYHGVIWGAYVKVLTIFLNHEIHAHFKRITCCSLVLKTYLLALLISIATVYTPALVLGIPTLGNDSASVVKHWTWVRLFAEFS